MLNGFLRRGKVDNDFSVGVGASGQHGKLQCVVSAAGVAPRHAAEMIERVIRYGNVQIAVSALLIGKRDQQSAF